MLNGTKFKEEAPGGRRKGKKKLIPINVEKL
jgi:hypothetical protein